MNGSPLVESRMSSQLCVVAALIFIKGPGLLSHDATSGYRFAVTRWRSGMDWNCRSRWFSYRIAGCLGVSFSPSAPIGAHGERGTEGSGLLSLEQADPAVRIHSAPPTSHCEP